MWGGNVHNQTQLKGFIMPSSYRNPPIEDQCTLKQACEYLGLGWRPTTPDNEDLCKPDQYIRSTNYAFLSHGSAFGSPIITPDNNRYNIRMSKALFKLYDLLRSGAVIATGIPDPALPDWTENDIAFNNNVHKRHNYTPSEHTERIPIVLPDEWEIDVIYNWIVTVPNQPSDQTSFRDVRIDFATLYAAYPIKQHTVTLTDDGYLCDYDGTTRTIICKLRAGTTKRALIEFYTENPYRTITKQDLKSEFVDPKGRYGIGDRMDQYIFNAFAKHPDLRAACFPIATTKEVRFRPTFTDADMCEP